MFGWINKFIKAVSVKDSDKYFVDESDAMLIGNLMSTLSGVTITENQVLQLASGFACVRVIAEDVASLPWKVIQQEGDNTNNHPNHKIAHLLRISPNQEIPSFNFKETLQAHALTWGNGYAEIERNIAGDPIALWILEPHRVTPKRNDVGNIVYEVREDDGTVNEIPASRIFHHRGLGYDGLRGYSPVRLGSNNVALSKAMELFGAAFFGNGCTLTGVLRP